MGVERKTPGASPRRKTLEYLLSLDSNNSNNSRSRQSSFQSEREELLSTISYCTRIFTFNDPPESPSQQDLKKLKLNQLLFTIRASKQPLSGEILQPLITMLSANLFRPLPPSAHPFIISDFPDDEDPVSAPEPTWSHLQIVYDILLRLVINEDPKSLRDHLSQSFVTNLLSLFQSEDSRERDSLKNVYHRIYSKFTFYRSFMRKSMNDVFLHFIYESERHHGIGELLEIWGSIINGFTVPLKKEHKLFLQRVLVPLHKPKGMQAYHRQLAYCVSQFVQKEPVLGGVVVRGILRFWPLINCQKELLLIGELEEIVENIDPEQYRKLALPLCTQMAKCFTSCNSQVAERALVWNNEQFRKVASQAMEEVFRVIVEGLENNLKWHWSKGVRQLTENIKMMLEEMDPSLYAKCLREIEIQESEALQEEIERKQKWERIERMAAAAGTNPNHITLQQQPRCLSVSIKKANAQICASMLAQ